MSNAQNNILSNILMSFPVSYFAIIFLLIIPTSLAQSYTLPTFIILVIINFFTMNYINQFIRSTYINNFNSHKKNIDLIYSYSILIILNIIIIFTVFSSLNMAKNIIYGRYTVSNIINLNLWVILISAFSLFLSFFIPLFFAQKNKTKFKINKVMQYSIGFTLIILLYGLISMVLVETMAIIIAGGGVA